MTDKQALTFFVVDDDPAMVSLVTVVLEAAGHTARSTVAGANAIADITAARPDVVLTDLMMPELDGLELCREVLARDSSGRLRVVFFSGRTGDIWRQKALEAGAVGYITKPLDAGTFAAQVEGIVRASGDV